MNKKETIEEAFWAIGINQAPAPGHVHYEQASRLYDRSLLFVLNDASWAFARRVKVLPGMAAMSSGVLRPGLMVTLPDDCIKIVSCSAPQWTLEGRNIFFGEEKRGKLTLKYLSKAVFMAQEMDNEAPYSLLIPSGFIDCLKYRLAALLAMPMTGSASMMGNMEAKYTQERAKAVLNDVRQYGGHHQRPDPLEAAEGGDRGNHPYFAG